MSYHTSMQGLGQLTMDPKTQALLKECSDNCEKQYGVSSGKPDVLSLTACFASCNVQYPPTVAVPGGGTVTPPAFPPVVPPVEPVPPVIPGVTDPVPPPPPPGPGATKPPVVKAGSGDMKMWVIGGAVAVAAVGAFLYFKK